ncbi:cysteine hydrolase family protein [Mesoaciditoga sp.]
MRKALMVVDMQNDFVTKNGSLYFEKAESVKPVVLDCVKKYIENNAPIIFTQDWHDEYDKEFNIFPKHCIKDTWGAQLFDNLKKIAEEYDNAFFVKKKKYSAFYRTNLDEKLRTLSPKTVEVCGVTTNICVLFNVEELRNRDFEVIVYENAVASYDDNLHDFAIQQIKDVLGAKICTWR